MRWLALLLLLAGPVQANCRQALLLALDVSGSVDAREYQLQRQGLSAALLAPDVAEALLASPDWPVKIAVFEWAGARDQTLVIDWTPVTAETLPQIAATLSVARGRPSSRSTALGGAMTFAAEMFRDALDCTQLTLDISADGKNNDAPSVSQGRDRLPGVTINALTIGSDTINTGDQRQVHVAELSAYYRRGVIQGQGAFVEVALGYQDYARAMRRKLLREVSTMVFGAAR